MDDPIAIVVPDECERLAVPTEASLWAIPLLPRIY